MASGGLSGDENSNCHHGYKCITKEDTTPDFRCTSCRHILREPSLTACCSQNFCSDFLKDKKRCPSCGEELHYGSSKYLHKQVQKLLVMCTQRTHKCDWEGEITDLDEHMSLCEYVQVPCNKCDQNVGKGQLEAHLEEECPKREYSCPHCGFKDTYSFVTNAHFSTCSNAPVTCPNECGVAGERDNMEKHLEDECPLHYVECSFRQAGCMQKFRRENREKHMQGSIGSHLASLANVTFKMCKVEELASKKLESEGNDDNGEEEEPDKMMTAVDSRKEEEISDLKRTVNTLLERVNNLAQSITEEVNNPENVTERVKKHKELEKKLQEKEDKIQQLRMSLEDHNSSQMELEMRLARVEKTLNNTFQDAPASQSVTFNLKGFAARKESKEQWVSPILTQNQYKLKFVVWPSGQSKGKGTHVSVWLEQEVRDIDNPPAHIFVVFELLNQLSDLHHIQANSNFQLTNQRYVGAICNQLIEHSELEYDPLKGTQYLVEDTLKFRVQVFIVKKKAG